MSGLLKIGGKSIASKDVPKYTWNADLVYFDGPLISLFKGDDGADALFVWLDCNEVKNRWCIVPIVRGDLEGYLSGEISLKSVYESAGFLTVFDRNSALKRGGFKRAKFSDLPKEYLPSDDSFLTDDISTDEAKAFVLDVPQEYDLGLDGEIYMEDMSIIQKLYQQLYSYHYGLEHLGRLAVRNTVSNLMSDWSGGFSAVNLFSGLKNVMPTVHMPRIVEMRYNSPGHIKLSLLESMAKKIERAAEIIVDEKVFSEFEGLYKDIYKFFKGNDIAGFDDERNVSDDNLTEGQLESLTRYRERFFSMMEWEVYQDRFSSIDVGVLGQLRSLLAYYRRLKQLRRYMVDGKLFIGHSQLL